MNSGELCVQPEPHLTCPVMVLLKGIATVVALFHFSSGVNSYPHLQGLFRRRQISPRQVNDTYDYIVVGGGQSGLVVANRLSEDHNGECLVAPSKADEVLKLTGL